MQYKVTVKFADFITFGKEKITIQPYDKGFFQIEVLLYVPTETTVSIGHVYTFSMYVIPGKTSVVFINGKEIIRNSSPSSKKK